MASSASWRKTSCKRTPAKVSEKTDSFVATYKRELSEGNPNAEQNLRDRLGLIAFVLAIQAGVNSIISQMILDEIGKSVHGEKVYEFESTPGHHELRRENKISLAQSKRLAAAKKEKRRIPSSFGPIKKPKRRTNNYAYHLGHRWFRLHRKRDGHRLDPSGL
jgi:hypothetical protein